MSAFQGWCGAEPVSSTLGGVHGPCSWQVVEELASVGRALERQIAAGEVEDVSDPEEVDVVLGALNDTPDEPELTPEEAKSYLDERRKRGA